MKTTMKNNQVTMEGTVVSDFIFSHEVLGEKFYIANLAVKRLSESQDIIPIQVSDRLLDMTQDYIGSILNIEGQFRSYNKHENDKTRLMLYVFVKELKLLNESTEDKNKAIFDGYLCKKPVYRETPLGREITDIILAVNRPYGKSDYIPCIVWGRNAKFVESFDIGTRVKVEGRIQSRVYNKKVSETESVSKTAYEVSVSRIEKVEE